MFGDDRVSVSTDNRGNLKVKTDFAPDALFGATAVREIRATLGAGRDSFTAAHDVTTPMYVNGVRFVNERGGGRGVAGSITRSLFSDRLVA